MPSRRTVLGAGAATAASLGTLWTVRDGPIQASDPPPDTWPQHRHDASNTARADLPVPSEPTVAWSRRAIEPSFPSLVVGTDAVYVGGQGVTALGREAGRRRWYTDTVGSELALGNLRGDVPTLYVAHGTENDGPGGRSYTLRAYDATDGTERWRHGLPSSAYGIVPTRAGIIVGCHDVLLAVGRDGRRRWTEEPPGSGAVYPVVHQGTLYAGLPGYVRRYRHRRLLATLLGFPPDTDWRGRDTGLPVPPTATRGRLVMGTESPAFEGGDPVVHAFDLNSGERLWGASPQLTVDRQVLTPVPFGTTGLTALSVGEPDTGTERTLIVGIDLQDGSFEFRRLVNARPQHVAAGADCAVLGGNRGALCAYEPDGHERWQTTVSGRVAGLAVLNRRVIVARADGHVEVFA